MLSAEKAKALAQKAQEKVQEDLRRQRAAEERQEKERQRLVRLIESDFDNTYDGLKTKLYTRAAGGQFFILRDSLSDYHRIKDALVSDEVWPRSLADVISASEVAYPAVMQSLLKANAKEKKCDLIYYWGSARVSTMKRELGGMLFFIASKGGQRVLESIDEKIQQEVAKGASGLALRWSSLEFGSCDLSDRREAIAECLQALGFDTGLDYKTLEVHWKR